MGFAAQSIRNHFHRAHRRRLMVHSTRGNCFVMFLILQYLVEPAQGQAVNMPSNVQDVIQRERGTLNGPSGNTAGDSSPGQWLNWKWYTRVSTPTTTVSSPSFATSTSTVRTSNIDTVLNTTSFTRFSSTVASPASSASSAIRSTTAPSTLFTTQTLREISTTPTPASTTATLPMIAATATTSVTTSSGQTGNSLGSTPFPDVTLTTSSTRVSTFPTVIVVLSPGTTRSPLLTQIFAQTSAAISRTTADSVNTRQTVRITRPQQTPVTQVTTYFRPPTTVFLPSVPSTTPSGSLDGRRRSVAATSTALSNAPSSLLALQISVPSTDNVTSAAYQTELQDRLSFLYQLAEAHYEVLHQNLSESANGTPVPTGNNLSGADHGNFSAQLYQLFWNDFGNNESNNLTVVFVVKHDENVILTSDAMQRLVLLSDDELADVLGTTLTRRPNPAADMSFGWNSSLTNGFDSNTNVTNYGLATGVVNSTRSWSLIAAIVGISTVAVVLLCIALIWTILFLYRKCTKRPVKTAQAPVVLTDNTEIVRIPVPATRIPISVDHGVQTIILPRRTVSVAPSYGTQTTMQSDGFPQMNGVRAGTLHDPNRSTGMGRIEQNETVYSQYSYAGQAPRYLSTTAAKLLSPGESSMSILSPPPLKPPRMINEPQVPYELATFGSRRRVVQSPDESKAVKEIPSFTNSRVKLLSVVKTNRVDPQMTNPGLELASRNFLERNDRSREKQEEPTDDVSGYRLEEIRVKRPDNPVGPRKNGAVIASRRHMVVPADRRNVFDSNDEDYLSPGNNPIPLRPSRNGVLPYEETVQEIRREVRLWRRSQNSYSPNRYG